MSTVMERGAGRASTPSGPPAPRSPIRRLARAVALTLFLIYMTGVFAVLAAGMLLGGLNP